MRDEIIQKTLDSGIVPIVMDSELVVTFPDVADIMRTSLVINSLDIGVLTQKQYRFVARRTKQGNALVERHIDKLFRAIPEILEANSQIKLFTLPAYPRLLKDGLLHNLLFNAFLKYDEVKPELICIEVSADILYEDLEVIRAELDSVRELGVKIAVCELGDRFCPVFRLSELDFDIAFLDSYAVSTLGTDEEERVLGSLVNFLHTLNVFVVASGLRDAALAESAKRLGCDAYTVGSFDVSTDATYDFGEVKI